MKKSVAGVCACVLFTVASAHAQRGVAVLDGRVPFESKTVKGIPYSAELVSENIQVLPDGNRIVQRTTGRVYRDSEGRVRREENRASGAPNISITDVVALTSFSLNSERREAIQTPMPLAAFVTTLGGKKSFFIATPAEGQQAAEEADVRKRELARSAEGRGGRGAPDSERQAEVARRLSELALETEKLAIGRGFLANSREQSVEDKLQDRLIGGVLATGTRRTTTIAAGAIGNEQPIKIVSEEWLSPDLQILVMTEHIDPRTGRSTYQLSNINRNEPDPSLFQIPADYTIRKSGLR